MLYNTEILARNCPGFIGRLAQPGAFGIAKWLCKDDSSLEVNGNELLLSAYDTNQFFNSISHDIYRLTSASRQTYADANKGDGHLAWRCIKLYYSAFFSAATISRLMGLFMIHINDQEKEMISKRCQAIDLDFTVSSNNRVRLMDDGRVVLRRIDQPTHEGTWRIFCDNISNAVKKAAQEMPSSRQLAASILDLEKTREFHLHNSAPGYLSQIRNEINYRQLHGCWPTAGARANSREIFNHIVKSVSQVRSKNNLILFSDLCKLTYQIQEDIIEYFNWEKAIIYSTLIFLENRRLF